MNLLKNDKFDDPDLGQVTVPDVATTTVATTAYFGDYNSEFESEPVSEDEKYSAYNGARPNAADYTSQGWC